MQILKPLFSLNYTERSYVIAEYLVYLFFLSRILKSLLTALYFKWTYEYMLYVKMHISFIFLDNIIFQKYVGLYLM